MIAKRLVRVTNDLIGEAQICAVLGRTIRSKLHILRYTLEGFENNSGKGGTLVYLNQAIAFDGVDPPYPVSVFAQFGLDLGFLRCTI